MRRSPEDAARRAASLLAWFGAAALVAIMALTFLDVIGRNLLGGALVGTVESVMLLMGVLVFCGLALTEANRRHVVVDTFQLMFPKKARRAAAAINAALAAGIAGLLAWRLVVKTVSVIESGETTQIWELPFWPTSVVMSAGILLFVVVLAFRLAREFRNLFVGGAGK